MSASTAVVNTNPTEASGGVVSPSHATDCAAATMITRYPPMTSNDSDWKATAREGRMRRSAPRVRAIASIPATGTSTNPRSASSTPDWPSPSQAIM